MKLPNQSQPVIKSSTATYHGDVNASSAACTACMTACSLLSGFAKTLCKAACNATVC